MIIHRESTFWISTWHVFESSMKLQERLYPSLLKHGGVDADGKDEAVAGDVLGSVHLVNTDGKLR